MNHMTTILTNLADIYLDLYAIAHDIKRPLTPEQLHTASQTHHDMMARREINGLFQQHRPEPTDDADEDALKALIAQFVEIYMGRPDTTPLDENTADDITDDFHALLMDEYVNPFLKPADDSE